MSGERAWSEAEEGKGRAVACVKRVIGLQARDPAVKEVAKDLPYKVLLTLTLSRQSVIFCTGMHPRSTHIPSYPQPMALSMAVREVMGLVVVLARRSLAVRPVGCSWRSRRRPALYKDGLRSALNGPTPHSASPRLRPWLEWGPDHKPQWSRALAATRSDGMRP
jgi:hypothetical protein